MGDRPFLSLPQKRELEIKFNLEIKCAFSYREKMETNEIVSFIVKTSSVFILKDSKKNSRFLFPCQL